jgi:hypothetical protein
MRKTITKSLVLAVSILCLLVLGACPPDAGGGTESSGEETKQVTITNIPATVGNGNKKPFKVYIQFSTGMDASAGYVAKGEAKLSSEEATEVTITNLKNASGNTWADSGKFNVCVLIAPESVDSIDDIDAKPKLSVQFSQNLALNWKNDLLSEGMINFRDKYSLAKLYNGIIVDSNDPDIKGTKARAKDSD